MRSETEGGQRWGHRGSQRDGEVIRAANKTNGWRVSEMEDDGIFRSFINQV